MGLLRADLQALGNVLRQGAARRLLLGQGLALLLLAAMSLLLGRALLEHPEVWQLANGSDPSLRQQLATALMPCTLVTAWLGLGLAQRLLFESPELPLWLGAPIGRRRAALQVLLRVSFVVLLWSAAMAAPFAALVLDHADAPRWSLLLLPLAMLLVVLPLLCPIMSLQLVLQRFFAGPLLQLVFTLLAALASLLFSLFLLVSVLAPARAQAAQLSDLASGHPELPWTVDAAAHLLLLTAGEAPDPARLLPALGWACGTLLLYGLLAGLHPRAVEAHARSRRPLFRARLRRSWPGGVAASIRHKELMQLLQQPSQLFSMLMFGVMVFVLANQGFVAGVVRTAGMPPVVSRCAALLLLWFMAVLLVLGAHMGRIALWDGSQWPLYMASPARPAAILLGKLQAIALLLLWPIAVVALAGAAVLRVDGTALGLFLLLALIGSLIALGVVAVVGTLPRIIRPDAGGQIEQGSRSLLAALLLIVGFELVAMVPGHVGWLYLQTLARGGTRIGQAQVQAAAPWVLLAALGYGVAVGGAGLWLGSRNFARLLRPR